MPDYMQYGAMGLLFLVLVGVGRMAQVFVMRALTAMDKMIESIDNIAKEHDVSHQRMYDLIDKGRCVYRPDGSLAPPRKSARSDAE